MTNRPRDIADRLVNFVFIKLVAVSYKTPNLTLASPTLIAARREGDVILAGGEDVQWFWGR